MIGDVVTIEIANPLPPVHGMADSLQHFRTIAFGVEFMQARITRSYAVPGQVDAALWWNLIPACYRDHVMPCVKRALDKNHGRKLTNETVYAFVIDLNRDIWQHVEPIMPGSIGMHDPEE